MSYLDTCPSCGETKPLSGFREWHMNCRTCEATKDLPDPTKRRTVSAGNPVYLFCHRCRNTLPRRVPGTPGPAPKFCARCAPGGSYRKRNEREKVAA